MDADGTLYTADYDGNAFLTVDTTTGDRTVVSSSSVGTGPAFVNPIGFLSNVVLSPVSYHPTSVATPGEGLATTWGALRR